MPWRGENCDRSFRVAVCTVDQQHSCNKYLVLAQPTACLLHVERCAMRGTVPAGVDNCHLPSNLLTLSFPVVLMFDCCLLQSVASVELGIQNLAHYMYNLLSSIFAIPTTYAPEEWWQISDCTKLSTEAKSSVRKTYGGHTISLQTITLSSTTGQLRLLFQVD